MLLPKTMLLIAHILGVVCGVGGVLMLDLNLLKFLRGARISDQDIVLTRFISGFVKLGLIVLWTSGLVIISIAPDGPVSVLANPKLQAKIVIVVVLTINALFVETLGLPLLYANNGRTLFDGVGHLRRSVILGSGAISTLSWTFPVVLGLAKEWSFKVPAHTILLSYAAVMAGTVLTLAVVSVPFHSARAAKPRVPLQDKVAIESVGSPDAIRPISSEINLAPTLHSAGTAGGDASAKAAWLLARRAGARCLSDTITVERVVEKFAAMQSDGERHEFRMGLFSALQERLGANATADQFAQTVASDPDLREKFAIVAPDQTSLNVFQSVMIKADRLKAVPLHADQASKARAKSAGASKVAWDEMALEEKAWDEVARQLGRPKAYARA